MYPKSVIIENILDAAIGAESEKIRNKVNRLLNLDYFDLCAEHSWAQLRDVVEVDFSDMDDETGMWLPSCMAGIDRVWDADDEIEYYPFDRFDIDAEDKTYRYYFYNPSVEAFGTIDDAVVSKGGTSFSSADDLGDDDYTGEYIKIASEMGFYLLSAATTFAPTYNGPKQDHCRIQFRPPCTRKLVLLDPSEEVIDDATVNVHYWKYPMPLYLDSEISVLPSDKILELRILRQIPEAKIRRPVSQRELDAEMEKCLGMNPVFPHNPEPKDRTGSRFKFSGQSMYSNRGR
jgi:hypothetical protein